MTTIVRLVFNTFTSNGSHHNQIRHFEAASTAYVPHRQVSAAEKAAEFLQDLWLASVNAERKNGKQDFSVESITEIDVEAGTHRELRYVEPGLPQVVPYDDVEAHYVVFQAGGSDHWSADGDLDEMHRRITAWGARFHAVVTVPGDEWENDPTAYLDWLTNGLYRTTDEPLVPATPYADVYPVAGGDEQLADSWFWSVGDQWQAVIAANETDYWDDGDDGATAGRPEVWSYPITTMPPSGTVSYRNVEGDSMDQAVTP